LHSSEMSKGLLPPALSSLYRLPLSSSAVDIKYHNHHFQSQLSFPNFSKKLKNTGSLPLSPLHFLSHLSPPSASARTEKMEGKDEAAAQEQIPQMKLLFVEMGVGYDQHGSLSSHFSSFLYCLIKRPLFL